MILNCKVPHGYPGGKVEWTVEAVLQGDVWSREKHLGVFIMWVAFTAT